MTEFMALVVLGLFLLAIPPLIPAHYRSWTVDNGVRAIGIILMLFAFASTSFVFVPDGHLGHLFRVYGGGSLTEGRIVAANGENGPQAEVFTPGFHIRPLLNVIYTVDTSKEEVTIPQGKVGVLTARDGAPLRSGQAFADPFPSKYGYQMLDATTFLSNGGQRGPQLTVLTPGKWRINRYLWDVADADAKEVKAGYVGVVKQTSMPISTSARLRRSSLQNATSLPTGKRARDDWRRRSFPWAALAYGRIRSSRANITSRRTPS